MSLFTSWLASPPPDAAIEIAPGRVTAATLALRGAQPVVQAYATEPLPAGAVVASLAAHNVLDRAAVAAAVRTALGRLEARAARVALVIPDLAAKVSLVRFDTVPPRRDDLDQLVRWQVRKSAPFPIEEACVTFTRGAPSAGGGGEFVVVLARRDVVEEYERVCDDAGAQAGIVDLATFSVLNLVMASPQAPAGDWLAVHMRPEYTSIAIVRGQDVIFFRNRADGDTDTLADLVHQTAMYYQDRLSGQGFGRVLMAGTGAGGVVEAARRDLEERLGITAQQIDPTAVAPLSERIRVSPDVVDALAPVTGMLLRTHSETAAA